MTDGPELSEDGHLHDWINNGFKGTDFKRNSAVKDIDAATIHAYPGMSSLKEMVYVINMSLIISGHK